MMILLLHLQVYGLITAKMLLNMFYKFLSPFLIILILNGCGGGGKGIPNQLSTLPVEEENLSETLDPNTDIFIPKLVDVLKLCKIRNGNIKRIIFIERLDAIRK